MTQPTVFYIQQADGSPQAVIATGTDRPLVEAAIVSARMSHAASAWRLDGYPDGMWLASTPEGESPADAFSVPDAVRQLAKAVGEWYPTHVVEGIAPEPRYLYDPARAGAGFADGPLLFLREWVEQTEPEFALRGGSYYRQGARFTGNIRALAPAALPNAAAVAPAAAAAAAAPSRPRTTGTNAVTSPVYAPDGSLVLGVQGGAKPPPQASPGAGVGLPQAALTLNEEAFLRGGRSPDEWAEREKHAAMTNQAIRDPGQQALEGERIQATLDRSQAAEAERLAAELERSVERAQAEGIPTALAENAPAEQKPAKGKGGRLAGRGEVAREGLRERRAEGRRVVLQLQKRLDDRLPLRRPTEKAAPFLGVVRHGGLHVVPLEIEELHPPKVMPATAASSQKGPVGLPSALTPRRGTERHGRRLPSPGTSTTTSPHRS